MKAGWLSGPPDAQASRSPAPSPLSLRLRPASAAGYGGGEWRAPRARARAEGPKASPSPTAHLPGRRGGGGSGPLPVRRRLTRAPPLGPTHLRGCREERARRPPQGKPAQLPGRGRAKFAPPGFVRPGLSLRTREGRGPPRTSERRLHTQLRPRLGASTQLGKVVKGVISPTGEFSSQGCHSLPCF